MRQFALTRNCAINTVAFKRNDRVADRVPPTPAFLLGIYFPLSGNYTSPVYDLLLNHHHSLLTYPDHSFNVSCASEDTKREKGGSYEEKGKRD